MTDTPPEVQARVDVLFARLSGSERVRMMSEMFDLGRALMIAGIRSQEPGISECALRVKVFERLYGEEITPDARERIVRRLSSDTKPLESR
jgi:hypothetical protein